MDVCLVLFAVFLGAGSPGARVHLSRLCALHLCSSCVIQSAVARLCPRLTGGGSPSTANFSRAGAPCVLRTITDPVLVVLLLDYVVPLSATFQQYM